MTGPRKTNYKKTQKVLKCHELFTTPGQPCYNNIVKSYIAAGYKNSKNAKFNASRLLHSDKFRQLLKESEKRGFYRAEIKGEYADNELVEAIADCKRTGDMTNRVALIRIYQQRCGQLSDKVVIDLDDSLKLERGYQRQAKQIASLIIQNRDKLPTASNALPEPSDGFQGDNQQQDTQDIVGDDSSPIIDAESNDSKNDNSSQ